MLGEEFVKLQEKAYRQIEKIERGLEKVRNKVRIPALVQGEEITYKTK